MVYKVAFVGAQKGDEGKGVKLDYYVQKAINSCPIDQEHKAWVVRWQGGANAGHTVEREGVRYALHQLPSGILIPGTFNLMGEGVFLEPRACLKEIKELKSRGIKIDNRNFGIASNAHVTLDYHIHADSNDCKLSVGHTSTGRGIKPTAVDKYNRTGIRFQEFLDRDSFLVALNEKFPDGIPNGNFRSFVSSYEREVEELKDYSILQENVLSDKRFMFGFGEGAQGFQLDIDKGLYPGVTSSNPGIVPFRADSIIGVVKMYESSIGGNRPFVGKMDLSLEQKLRDPWRENGTTTGKPRSLGWLDVVALKHAVRSSDIDGLISTCGDRLEDLSKIGEKVKIVVAYEINGKKFTEWDKSFHDRNTLYSATPVFEEFNNWAVFYDKEKGKLTPNAQRFVDRVQNLTDTEFVGHGYGPGINDVLETKQFIKRKVQF